MDTETYDRYLDEFLRRVRLEAIRAKGLFPTNRHQLAAFNEEVGEVNKAFIDQSRGDETLDGICTELVQAAGMAARLAIEGDQSFPYPSQEWQAWQRLKPTLERP